jgi:hypothetical protein
LRVPRLPAPVHVEQKPELRLALSCQHRKVQAMPGAAPCGLASFSQVALDPGEIVVRGRGEEMLLQSSDASIEVVNGHV